MNSLTDITAGIRADRFEAIKYETRPGKNGPVAGMQLGAQFVLRWIVQDAWKHISAGVATADRYEFYTAKSLFNDGEAWAGHERSTCIAIGRCLAYFVNEEMLPLHCVKPRASNKLYMLKGQ